MIGNIKHGSYIFSLAISSDEKLLACGGTEPTGVSVWNMTDGTEVARFSGLKQQTHALAFSSDNSLIAAANLWGGICVWRMENGEKIHEKPETSARKLRYLVFPETKKKSITPVMSSSSIYREQDKMPAPNGLWQATKSGSTIVLKKYKTTQDLASIDLAKYALPHPGVSLGAWSGDAEMLGVSGHGWAGIWFPHTQRFFFSELPSGHRVDALVVLHHPVRVVYAMGNALFALEMPADPILTQWEAYLSKIEVPVDPGFKIRRDWNWNVTQWGYDGVHTFDGKVFWYNHSHNPHAGGYGMDQEFENFLADGPAMSNVPENVLSELAQAVKAAVRENN